MSKSHNFLLKKKLKNVYFLTLGHKTVLKNFLLELRVNVIFSDIIKCFRRNLLRLIYVFKWLALCLSLWLSPAFPSGSVGKESSYNSGDAGLITGWGRSSGVGHGNSPQYSCLENPMDSGAWWSIDHAVTKSQTWLKWLSMHALSLSCFMSLSVSWALVYFCVLSLVFHSLDFWL